MSTSSKKLNGTPASSPTTDSADWRDITGRFKVVFDLMEKDQEANTERVRRQTIAIRRHVSEASTKRAKR
jgi:hypothetical protein